MNNIKKIITLFSFLLALNLEAAKADVLDGFMLKPTITTEYQKSDTQDFKNRGIGKQLTNLDNIVLGMNFRVHQYLGFNVNWAKNTFNSTSLDGFDLDGKASLDVQNINISSLIYVPLIGDNWLDGFAEIGVSDINSKIKVPATDGNFVNQKSHETALLYGAGLQLMPYDSNIAFRFGFQKYQSKLGVLNERMTAWRAGVLIPF